MDAAGMYALHTEKNREAFEREGSEDMAGMTWILVYSLT